MRIELILFDLDDTLMAFDLVSEKAWEKVIDVFIFNSNKDFVKDIILEKLHSTRKWYWSDPERHKIGRKNINNARREIVKLALKDYLDIGITELEKIADDYTQIHENLWYLFDDVEDTLKEIKAMNIKLGLVTNGTSESQRGKLKRFNIEKYFDYIYIEGEVGYGKPDKRIFEYVMEETKIPNDKIIMIGDNLIWDIETPQKLGIKSIWINTKGVNLEDSNIRPDVTIKKISDIKDLIE